MGLESNLLPCFWSKSNPVDYRNYNIEVPFSKTGGWILSFLYSPGGPGVRHVYFRILEFGAWFYE